MLMIQAKASIQSIIFGQELKQRKKKKKKEKAKMSQETSLNF